MNLDYFIKKISTEGLTPKAIEEYCTAVVLGELQTAKELGTKVDQAIVLTAMRASLDAQKLKQRTQTKPDSRIVKGGFHM